MNVKILSTIIISSFLLQGCSWSFFDTVEPIQVQTQAVEKTPLDLKEPKPLKPRKVEWFIVTPENFDEVFAELKGKKFDVVLYGLTDDGYQSLSMNLAELRTFIIHQQKIITAYKDYYEPPTKSSK